jgi:hypothetical protein
MWLAIFASQQMLLLLCIFHQRFVRYCRMAKKPEPTNWDVYKIAEKAVWLGTVEAPDKQSAMEKAAVEFVSTICSPGSRVA